MLVQRVSSATIITSDYIYGTQSDCDKFICCFLLLLWEVVLSVAIAPNPQCCSYQGLLICNLNSPLFPARLL